MGAAAAGAGAVAAGAVAAGAVAVAGAVAAGAVAVPVEDVAGADLPPPSAASADWQAEESDELCCCRQVSAALPPGCTPEHCAMKSERQADLMALCCAAVGCWAAAAPAKTPGHTKHGYKQAASAVCTFSGVFEHRTSPWGMRSRGEVDMQDGRRTVRYSYERPDAASATCTSFQLKRQLFRPVSAHRHRHRRPLPIARSAPRHRRVRHPC